jgi:hypothetical protein
MSSNLEITSLLGGEEGEPTFTQATNVENIVIEYSDFTPKLTSSGSGNELFGEAPTLATQPNEKDNIVVVKKYRVKK